MIVPTYDSTRGPVQLLCINGDRIEVSYAESRRFLTAPSFVTFLLTYSIFLVVMSGTVYGVETTAWFRTLFWPLNSAFIGIIYAATFWYCEFLAKRRGRNYVIYSLGIHILAVLIAVPLGGLLIGTLHGVEVAFSNLSLWDFLKAILIAIAFEFAVVNWIWPAETASWEREDTLSQQTELPPEVLRETFEQDLLQTSPRWPYFSYR